MPTRIDRRPALGRAHARVTHATVSALWLGLESRDPDTANHSRRVARLAAGVGRRMGLRPADLRTLIHAALLHDIGKYFVPIAVLNKPGALDPAEREVIERHVAAGVRIVASFPALRHLLPAIEGHHERVNGSGYPQRASGDGICQAARILAVADCWDALVSDRPYRRAMGREEAKEILREGAGHQFDPEVVEALMAVVG